MAWQYMDLCNRVLRRFNEVQLTSLTFSQAVGFQQSVKDAVNDALNDIYTAEMNWPFLWNSTSQITTGYENIYPLPSNYTQVDWNSFFRESSLSATVPVQALKLQFMSYQDFEDNNKEFDEQIIDEFNNIIGPTGAAQYQLTATGTSAQGTNVINLSSVANLVDGMVVTNFTNPRSIPGNTTITNVGLSSITLSADISAPGINTDDLIICTTTQYAQGQGGAPSQVFQTQDRLNFGLSTVPDTAYSIDYEYWYKPTDLVNATDVIIIPDRYSKVVIDGTTYYSYMFRDNVEEAGAAQKKFISGVSQMRTELINKQDYMRSDNIITGNYTVSGIV